MKRNQWLKTGAAFGAGIVAATLAANFIPKGALDPAAPAQAQILHQEQISVLSGDNFFATTNAEGDHVYLWHFERAGKKNESRVEYVTHATNAGPMMQ